MLSKTRRFGITLLIGFASCSSLYGFHGDAFEPISPRELARRIGIGFGPGYHATPCLPLAAKHYCQSVRDGNHPHGVFARNLQARGPCWAGGPVAPAWPPAAAATFDSISQPMPTRFETENAVPPANANTDEGTSKVEELPAASDKSNGPSADESSTAPSTKADPTRALNTTRSIVPPPPFPRMTRVRASDVRPDGPILNRHEPDRPVVTETLPSTNRSGYRPPTAPWLWR